MIEGATKRKLLFEISESDINLKNLNLKND